MERRTFVGRLATATVIGLADCVGSSLDGQSETTGIPDDDTVGDTSTETGFGTQTHTDEETITRTGRAMVHRIFCVLGHR